MSHNLMSLTYYSLVSYLEYESRFDLPHGTFLKMIKYNGQDGTWAKLERGEISWNEFCRSFSDEFAEVVCHVFFHLPISVELSSMNIRSRITG